MQQQTIGKHIQLRVCVQIIYVCNTERIIKIGQCLWKLYSNEGSSFSDSQYRMVDPCSRLVKYRLDYYLKCN